MLRLFLLISLLVSSLTLVGRVHASVTYTPGASIAMTGTNTNVRFDVASVLIANSSTETAPTLDTTTLEFTGTFYGSGIGWIVFASGSNQVSLNCGTQLLGALTSNCILTGIGWSENVGDIDFANVEYNPNTGLLSGSAMSFVGDIDLSSIALPLRPITLTVSTLVADHSATLTISGSWIYDAGNAGWNGTITPLTTIDPQGITGSNGLYTDIDFSLASSYEIEIIDPNGSITTLSPFVVVAGSPNTTLDSGHHAEDFCTNNPSDSNCPDGATRSATTLTQIPPTGAIANGTDAYTMTLLARDKYGNRVETGSMKLKYITTVKNIQSDILDNINYSSIDGDAFVSVGLQSGLAGSSNTTYNLSSTDIIYTIASTAPTDINNKIQLNSIEYDVGSDIALPGWKSSLNFAPMYEASVATVDPIVVNTPNTFSTIITRNDLTTIITPTIITTLQIGDGSSAEWRDLSSDFPSFRCANYPTSLATDSLCDWNNVSSIATSSIPDFSFTGTYTTWLSSTDTTVIETYIYYQNNGIDILYNSNVNTTSPATAASQRMRILGQSGEGVGGGASTRVDMINSIRERAALLSRNRSNYDDVDYIVRSADYTINSSSTLFAGEPGIKAKRTIIVLGGDIRIEANIDLTSHPLAIIALADSSGKGGNIIIDGAVTDIHGSLIAEHGITSAASSHQLYIHGSLVSANPPREIPPTSCPYFAGVGCIKGNYDLPGARDGFSTLTDTTGYTHIGTPIDPVPLIIEADPRLARDPAPAMSK